MRGSRRIGGMWRESVARDRAGCRWRGRLALTVVLGLVGALVSVAAPGVAQAADPAWSVVPSPNQVNYTSGNLNGVSCVSASSCFAVGEYYPPTSSASVTPRTLAESWNGSKWSIVPSPSNGSVGSSLAGISCVSASACTAVGYYDTSTHLPETLVESWNGSTWSIVSSPNQTAGGYLSGVSCVSATSCIAVGVYYTAGTNVLQTLVESWDGSTWSIVTSPDEGTGDNQLYGVSCVSATSCTAVGVYTGSSGVLQTLVESWDGSTWSIVTSPDEGTDDNQLSAVSCVSATSCTAVGNYDTSTAAQSLAESWDGSTWSIVASPDQGTDDNLLSGVSCVSATSCTAVGYYNTSSGVGQTLVESWDGSAWSIVASPNQGTGSNDLSAAACLSATSCTAVGSYTASSADQSLVVSWDGSTWSVVSSPSYIFNADSLNGVSCVSASFCVAVGSYYLSTGKVSKTLIESWNGSKWSIVPSPNKFTASNVLNHVSCVSASFCVAVGSWANGRAPLVESWNGSTWSIVPSGSPGNLGNYDQLLGVSCVSASFCVAVGFESDGLAGWVPLVESWDGSTWSVVPSPTNGRGDQLTSVSCSSASSCTAVGWQGYEAGISPKQTLVDSWNGSSWSVVSSPDPSTSNDVLSGVACASATLCTAVGSYEPSSSPQTLVESWDGSTWSVVSSPNQGTGGNVLSGISCPSASSCMAVGSRAGGERTLAESWNGSAWSVVSSPSPGSGDNQLLGIFCLPAGTCTAVGDFYANDGSEDSLTEMYS
jgi:hypothetical protein